MPRLGMIACVDSGQMSGDSCISRLHTILATRQDAWFVAESLRTSVDLRTAMRSFRVTQVDYEVFPVNPSTGDLGRAFDENRKKDHIDRLVGKIMSASNDLLILNGGLLNQIQELQESGHARAGFTAHTDGGIEIKVLKPKSPRALAEDETPVPGTRPDIRIELKGIRLQYPFPDVHVNHIHSVANILAGESD